MDTKLLTIRTLVSTLTSPSDQTRLASLRHLHRISNQDPTARPLISAAGAIPLLAEALYSLSHPIQEHAAATLLNLSISDRQPLISSPTLLDALSHVLSRHASTSSPAAVQSSAATLHSLLAVVAEYRPVVGAKHNILRALVDIIGGPNSPTRSVKDALKASFAVALHPPNRTDLIRFGAVPAIFNLMAKDKKRKSGIVEDATAVIAQIAGCEESEVAFRNVLGIPVLLGLLCLDHEKCSLRTKENTVSGLLNLVRYGGESVIGEVRERVEALDWIVYVQEHGSAKGKSKAVALLKILLDGGSNDKIVEDLYPVESNL
ncbi:U-box domain-containing protein 1-like [Gastrolobium bilobum]|uniref:U-box domain-containing protein 1-like n=1 Tax=Gastrolobium bilobum TaxID=150636 RepID=UPI002AB1FF56|nr:U-box domain-containing protein 1-like [Gastrolobium bilobum]